MPRYKQQMHIFTLTSIDSDTKDIIEFLQLHFIAAAKKKKGLIAKISNLLKGNFLI